MKTPLRVACVAAVVFFLSACTEDDNPGAPPMVPADPIMPLTVGNSWTIRGYYYDSVGTLTRSSAAFLAITRDSLFEGELWYGFDDNVIAPWQCQPPGWSICEDAGVETQGFSP